MDEWAMWDELIRTLMSDPHNFYPVNPYAYTIPPPTAKVGDRDKDRVCVFCKNKGHIRVYEIERNEVKRKCKLCGKEVK